MSGMYRYRPVISLMLNLLLLYPSGVYTFTGLPNTTTGYSRPNVGHVDSRFFKRWPSHGGDEATGRFWGFISHLFQGHKIQELKGLSTAGQNALQCPHFSVKFRKFSGAMPHTPIMVGLYSVPPQTPSHDPHSESLDSPLDKLTCTLKRGNVGNRISYTGQ